MNSNIVYNRLCLKNVPVDMTTEQILKTFFPDLENVEIFMPKIEFKPFKRFVFAQLNSKNEAILCMRFINRIAFKNVEASFAVTSEAATVVSSSSNENSKNGVINPYDFKKCAFCGTLNSEFLCINCSTLYYATFYCCKDHQERDWLRHKAECKPLPQLKRHADSMIIDKDHNNDTATTVEMPEVSDEENQHESSMVKRAKYYIPIDDSFIQEGMQVKITSVVTNKLVYLRPLCEEYDQLMDSLDKYSSTAAFLKEKPILNEHVLALFDSCWYRAKVQDFFAPDNDGNNTKVQLIDVGSELNVKWQELKYLNFRLRGRKSYTVKVILEDVIECNKTECINFLNKLKEPLLVYKIHGNQINEKRVTLRHAKNNAFVNDMINIWAKSADSRYYYDVSKVPKFSTKATIKIHVPDVSQLEEKKVMSCIPNEKFSDYFHMLDEIRKYSRNLPRLMPYVPELNEICLVNYKGEWCRGSYCINDLTQDFSKFILIDKMVDVTIDKKDIRSIPQSFAQHFYTSLCFVEGINHENVQRIKDKVEKEKFIFADVKYDAETQCPILYHLKL